MYWQRDKYYLGNLQEAYLELRRLSYVLISLTLYASDFHISGFCEDLDCIFRVYLIAFVSSEMTAGDILEKWHE